MELCKRKKTSPTFRGSFLLRLIFSSSIHQTSGALIYAFDVADSANFILIATLFGSWDIWSKSLFEVYTVHSKELDGIFSAPGDQDGSVVMGMVVIIQDVLALLPNAKVL